MGMRKIHYGWVICVTCTLLLFVTMGTVSNGFSIYLPYIMAERGLTHAQTSSLVTLRCLVAFVAMLLIGGYYRKVSLRVGTGLAVCCAGLAFWLYSAAETYPLFCVGAAVSGISYGLGSACQSAGFFYGHHDKTLVSFAVLLSYTLNDFPSPSSSTVGLTSIGRWH